jgi:hypothetical protein
VFGAANTADEFLDRAALVAGGRVVGIDAEVGQETL